MWKVSIWELVSVISENKINQPMRSMLVWHFTKLYHNIKDIEIIAQTSIQITIEIDLLILCLQILMTTTISPALQYLVELGNATTNINTWHCMAPNNAYQNWSPGAMHYHFYYENLKPPVRLSRKEYPVYASTYMCTHLAPILPDPDIPKLI